MYLLRLNKTWPRPLLILQLLCLSLYSACGRPLFEPLLGVKEEDEDRLDEQDGFQDEDGLDDEDEKTGSPPKRCEGLPRQEFIECLDKWMKEIYDRLYNAPIKNNAGSGSNPKTSS